MKSAYPQTQTCKREEHKEVMIWHKLIAKLHEELRKLSYGAPFGRGRVYTTLKGILHIGTFVYGIKSKTTLKREIV
jgi:hypothetical protein